MYETETEMAELQELLTRSMNSAGAHVRSIFARQHRLSARQVCRYLQGVRQVAAATVNSRGEPRVAPIDAVFYHAEFYLSTDSRSLRARHLSKRPAVSVTYFEAANPAIIVHGRAGFIGRDAEDFGPLDSEWVKAYGKSTTSLSETVEFIRVKPEIMLAYSFQPQRYPES